VRYYLLLHASMMFFAQLKWQRKCSFGWSSFKTNFGSHAEIKKDIYFMCTADLLILF
jgi:hypothetical protein